MRVAPFQTHRHLPLAALVAAAALLGGCASSPEPGFNFNQRAQLGNITADGRPARLMLDTGANVPWLTKAGARRLGVKSAAIDATYNDIGQSSVSVPLQISLRGETVTVPMLVFDDVDIPRYDGAVGWPSVRDNILVFDPATRTMRAVDAVPEEATHWLKLRILPDDNLHLETLLEDGDMGRIDLDTGNPYGATLPLPAWESWFAAQPKDQFSMKFDSRNAGNAPFPTTSIWARDVSIGQIELNNLFVEKGRPQRGFVGMLGLMALNRMDLVLDGKAGYAYVRPLPADVPYAPRTSDSEAGFFGLSYKSDHDSFSFVLDDWIVADNVKINPGNFFTAAGFAKVGAGNLTGAVADFDRAIEFDPREITPRLMRGSVRALLADFAGAETDFAQVLALDSQNTSAFRARGDTRLLSGNVTGALADYDAAIALNVDDAARSRLRRHFLLLRRGEADPEFAANVATWKDGWTKSLGQYVAGSMDERMLLQNAKKMDGGSIASQQGEAYYTIGLMRLQHGDLTGARDYFLKVKALNRRNEFAYYFAQMELARLDSGAQGGPR